jgi:hypothetical protein
LRDIEVEKPSRRDLRRQIWCQQDRRLSAFICDDMFFLRENIWAADERRSTQINAEKAKRCEPGPAPRTRDRVFVAAWCPLATGA